MTDRACPCGSGKSIDACCGALLDGTRRARTPEQLMRSRYTAFALGGHGEYLLKTWFPATAQGLSVPALSQREHEWFRLDILSKSQQGEQGFVEFKAWYRVPDGSEHCQHEKSVFQRIAGAWLYVGGEVTTG